MVVFHYIEDVSITCLVFWFCLSVKKAETVSFGVLYLTEFSKGLER